MPYGIFTNDSKTMIQAPLNSVFHIPDITRYILNLLPLTKLKGSARTCRFFSEFAKQQPQTFYTPIYTPLNSMAFAGTEGWKMIEDLPPNKKLLLIPNLEEALEYANSQFGTIGCYKLIISPAKLLSHPSCRTLGFGIYETMQSFPHTEIVSYIYENNKIEVANHNYRVNPATSEQPAVESTSGPVVELSFIPLRKNESPEDLQEKNARMISIMRIRAGLWTSESGGAGRCGISGARSCTDSSPHQPSLGM